MTTTRSTKKLDRVLHVSFLETRHILLKISPVLVDKCIHVSISRVDLPSLKLDCSPPQNFHKPRRKNFGQAACLDLPKIFEDQSCDEVPEKL
jgi:hypothetical protein